MGRGVKDKRVQQASALERIHQLFDAAALVFLKDSQKAHTYIAHAHQLMLRAKVKLPAVLKRRYCKSCRSLWVPSRTVRVRLTKGRLVYTCLVCKRISRMPLG